MPYSVFSFFLFSFFECLNNRHLFLTALEMRSTKSKSQHGRLNPEVSLLDLQATNTSRICGSAGVHSSRLYSGRQLGFRLQIGWIYFRLWVGFVQRKSQFWLHVGNCFFDLLSLVKVLVSQLCPTLCNPWTVVCQAPCLWDSPGKNTGEGCHFLFPGIYSTQGLNPGLLHCRWILYHWNSIPEKTKR